MCKRGRGQTLCSISASEGVIISHPGVTGAKTVIWSEGGGGKTWRRMLQRSGKNDRMEDMEKKSS